MFLVDGKDKSGALVDELQKSMFALCVYVAVVGQINLKLWFRGSFNIDFDMQCAQFFGGCITALLFFHHIAKHHISSIKITPAMTSNS